MKSKQQKDPGLEALNKLLRASSKEESKAIITAVRKYIREHNNDLKHCPMCSQPITDTLETFTKETAYDPIKIIYEWVQRTGKHAKFKAADIKPLLNHTQYCNLNHLIAFEGILYRPNNPRTGEPYTSTYYAMHRGRAEEFLRGYRPGPVQILRARFTRERIDQVKARAGEMPHIADMVDDDGIYSPPTLL